MTPEPITCPYCNARVPAHAPGESRGRIACPRCGETFPYRPADGSAVAAGPPPAGAPGPPSTVNGTPRLPSLLRAAPTHLAVQIGVVSVLVVAASLVLRVAFPDSASTQKAFPFMFLLGAIGSVAAAWLWYFRRPRTNAATAVFLLGNMALIALIVLPFALLTTGFRRGNDPPRKSDLDAVGPGKDGKAGAAPAPAELAGLGYLPHDCNLVVGVHMAQLRRERGGKAFLEQPSWGPLQAALAQVEKWTGLRKEAIDHVALGVRTDFFPRLTVVVRTVLPYDPASFRVLLDQTRPMEHQGRLLYPLQLRPLGQGALWCVGDRTLLLTLWWDPTPFQEMKQSLPLKPRAGDEGLRPALRDCLEKRLPRGALVWVAGESVPAPVLAAVLPFGRGRKEQTQELTTLLKKVRVFDAALRAFPGTEEVALVGDLECADPGAAAELQLFLVGQKVQGLGAPKVAGPESWTGNRLLLAATVVGLGGSPRGGEAPAALALLARGRPARPDEAERWVSFQLRAGPALLREALRGGQMFPRLGQP